MFFTKRLSYIHCFVFLFWFFMCMEKSLKYPQAHFHWLCFVSVLFITEYLILDSYRDVKYAQIVEYWCLHKVMV